MSKLFEVLKRLEEHAREELPEASREVHPASLREPPPNDAARAAFGAEVTGPLRAVIARPGDTRGEKNRIIGVAFDIGIVSVALILFVGICFSLFPDGGAALFQNRLVLLTAMAIIGMLYWLLCSLKQGETPGRNLAAHRSLDSEEHGRTRVARLGPASVTSRLGALSQPKSRTLAEELVLANRILASEGVLDAYGSVSVRDDRNPGHFLMAHSVAAGLVTVEDIDSYDFNGSGPSEEAGTLFAERFIHAEIYRTRPDVAAIVNCRGSELMPFAASSVCLKPISQLTAFLGGGVPVFESRQVGAVTDSLLRARSIAQALARTLGDSAAVLIRGQGATVVGPSLHTAVGRAYYMSMNAKVQAQAILLGGTVADVGTTEQPPVHSEHEFDRPWQLWERKLLR